MVLVWQVWINQGDIILVGLRDYQDAKADVILKYNPDEARNLKSYGELPEHGKDGDFLLRSREGSCNPCCMTKRAWVFTNN